MKVPEETRTSPLKQYLFTVRQDFTKIFCNCIPCGICRCKPQLQDSRIIKGLLLNTTAQSKQKLVERLKELFSGVVGTPHVVSVAENLESIDNYDDFELVVDEE